MNGFRPTLRPIVANRRALVPLSFALFLTFGYFVSGPAWNQNSRFALTRALVERQRTDIDPDRAATGDKSKRRGHIYSDKAPGTSFIATIPYALFLGVRSLAGGERPAMSVIPLDPQDDRALAPRAREPGDRLDFNRAWYLALYFCSLFTVAIPSVLGTASLYTVARLNLAHTHALWLALVYALGTPALTYSTALYGHQLAASALIMAFAIVVTGPSRCRSLAPPVTVGLACGLAVITEYPCAPVAGAMLVYGLVRRGPRFAGAMVLGGLPLAIGLGLYHTVAFGHPLQTGYDFVSHPQFATGMALRYGIGLPTLEATAGILFGSYRGLFYLSPVLIVATWGLVDLVRRPGSIGRSGAIFACMTVAYFVALNAGYYMWDGGAAVGPRHCVPALPFLALGLVRVIPIVPRAFIVLAVVSIAQLVAVTGCGPEAAQYGNVLWEFAVDRWITSGSENITRATNLGQIVGLRGLVSLVPLGLLWYWIWPGQAALETAADPESGSVQNEPR